jgi:S-adenosylmethionine decarboxylase
MIKQSFISFNLIFMTAFCLTASTQLSESYENYQAQDLFEFNDVHLPTGRHVIADLNGCQECYYKDDIESILRNAAEQASATVLDIKIFQFQGMLIDGKMVHGMTGMVILSESHIAFHTWPENGFVACDIFTCGSNALPEKALQVLCDYFKPSKTQVKILGRGLANLTE